MPGRTIATIADRDYTSERELRQRVIALDAEHAGQPMPDDARAEWNAIDDVLEEFDARRARLRELSRNPNHLEAGATFGPALPDPQPNDGPASFDRAQNVIEDHVRSSELPSSDADRLDALLRGSDRHYGLDAQYVAAVGNPEYREAFAKLLRYGDGAHLRMSREQQEAVQAVVHADEVRAMSTGVTTSGGFGVPLALDPSIVISSAGTISPIRELASQVTIATREYKAVTSAGVTATFQAELTEVADGTPVLAQPDIFTEKAQAFVPFSIEVGMDYPNLAQELGGLFADAKNVLEGVKFALGAGHGSNEPQGLVTGLSGTSIFTTASAGTWVIADVYAAVANLSPRWQADAKWLMSLPVFNTTKRLVGSGSTTEPQIISADGSQLVNRPWYIASDMATTVASTNLIAVYGNIEKAYRIVDRIGLTVELVPHIFGPANRFPLGERALYMYWRVGAGVLVNDAARVIKVHV